MPRRSEYLCLCGWEYSHGEILPLQMERTEWNNFSIRSRPDFQEPNQVTKIVQQTEKKKGITISTLQLRNYIWSWLTTFKEKMDRLKARIYFSRWIYVCRMYVEGMLWMKTVSWSCVWGVMWCHSRFGWGVCRANLTGLCMQWRVDSSFWCPCSEVNWGLLLLLWPCPCRAHVFQLIQLPRHF